MRAWEEGFGGFHSGCWVVAGARRVVLTCTVHTAGRQVAERGIVRVNFAAAGSSAPRWQHTKLVSVEVDMLGWQRQSERGRARRDMAVEAVARSLR